MDAREQAMIDLVMKQIDGTENEGQPRRERDPRRLACRRTRGCRSRRPSALPLPRRHRRAHAARSDDERHQRRRARRQQPRRPGVHDHPGRLRQFLRSAPRRRRDLPSPEEDPARQEADHRRRRRRWLRTRSQVQRRSARPHPHRDREGRLPPRRSDLPRPRRRGVRVLRKEKVQVRRHRSLERRHGRLLRRPAEEVPDHLHRRRDVRGRLGRLGLADRRPRLRHAARRRRPLRHESCRSSPKESSAASPTRFSSRSIRSAR